MHKILTIGFPVLLFLDAAVSYLCIYCREVQEDNTCFHPEKTCAAGLLKYCFTRKVTRDGISRVTRGCSSECYDIQSRHKDDHMFCCEEDLCNNHNAWKQTL